MAKRMQAAALADGRGWVWAVDALGLGLAASLLAACAGAPALAHMSAWLLMALPLAGFAMASVAEEHSEMQPIEAPSIPVRTIVITPRPSENRGCEESFI